MSYDIAVIGISCKATNTDTPQEFKNIFKDKKCLVIDLPEDRKKLLHSNPDDEYFKFSYLSDIDKFDYEYFNIPKAEAIGTDPQQRIILEMTENLLRNAGYSRKKLYNSNTAVVLATSNSGYAKFCGDLTSSSFIGTINAYCAGRVSYFYGLNGPSYVVDSTCSSSIVAIKQICSMIKAGEISMGIAGAINLLTEPVKKTCTDVMGITSHDCLTRSFDDDADGTGGAEAAGLVLLKPLKDAVADGDNIYAVIKECELNNDGARGANIAAPSPDGQAELIERVINKSHVNPEQIEFVEAHGTATRIGDPIEVRSITEAFSKYTDKKSYCALTAAKSNIGHGGVAAGIIGFIKAVIQLYYNEAYPICLFKKPNSLIDFNNTPVFPCEKITPLMNKYGYGLINSFGFSGTNSCILLQKYNRENNTVQIKHKKYPFVFSDMSPERLINQLTDAAKYSESISENEFDKFAYTVCNCDEGEKYRTAFSAFDAEDFRRKINISCDNIQVSQYKKAAILLSGNSFEKEEFHELCSIVKTLKSCNLNISGIFGSAGGNAAVQLINGKITEEQAFEAVNSVIDNKKINSDAAKKALFKISEKEDTVFAEIGRHGVLSVLAEEYGKDKIICGNLDLSELICALYLKGIDFNPENFFENKIKIPLYGYRFKKVSCWPNDNISDTEANKKEYDNSADKIHDVVRELWFELITDGEFSDDDDFYNVGGNSLMIMQLVNRIKNIYGLSLDFDEIDDNATVNDLSELIREKLEEKTENSDNNYDISNPKHIDGITEAPVSYEQRSMLIVSAIDNNSQAYKMSSIMKLKGKLNTEFACEAMRNTVETYSVLHTVYEKRNGDYIQKIFDINSFKFDIKTSEDYDNEDEIIKYLRGKSNNPYDLEREIPVRCTLVVAKDDVSYMLFQMHHIVGDNLTVGIIINCFFDYYSQLIEFGKIKEKKIEKITYLDYSLWQKDFLEGSEGKKELEFWKNYLSPVPEYAEIPYDYEKTVYPGKAASCSKIIPLDKSDKIRNYICKNKTTLFVYTLSAYNMLVHRYTMKKDFCTGITASNRRFNGGEESVGFFANTLAFRNRIDESDTFKTILHKNKENINMILNNQEIPFEIVVAEVLDQRNENQSALFRSMFTPAFNESAISDNHLFEISTIPDEEGNAKFDMLIMVGENAEGNIVCGIQYDTSLYNKETIEMFIDNYISLMDKLPEEDDICIDLIEFSDDNEDFEQNYDF